MPADEPAVFAFRSPPLRTPSRGFAVNEWISNLVQDAKVTLPQKAIEQPLADVLRAMEEKSGRTFPRASLG